MGNLPTFAEIAAQRIANAGPRDKTINMKVCINTARMMVEAEKLGGSTGSHTVTLDSRETATILAALRYWQDVAMKCGDHVDTCWDQIAADGGEVEPLAAPEIDTLCSKVNFDCEADASF